MAKDFLLEIGTEPFPARFIAPSVEQLSRLLTDALKAGRFGFEDVKTYATLRRLTVLVVGLEEKSPACEAVDYGAPLDKARAPDGKWTPAAEGFARKLGISVAELKVEKGPKGVEQVCWRREIPGESAEKFLARAVPEALGRIQFPKSLEWEPTRFRFGRPIRSVAALLGGRVVAFSVAGVKSGKTVRGLAALAKKPAALRAPSEYLDTLRDELVLADVEERRQALLKRLAAAAKQAGGRLDEDPDLLDETVYMTEQPTPVAGSFDAEFLKLPAPLLSLVLKKQLKFFPVLDASGRLLACFVGVRDGVSEGQELVREGYERVLSARCNDAVFFCGRDSQTSLESKLPMLSRVTYQKALGSMADKAQRVRELTRILCSMTRQDRPVDERAADEIARLCYADLVTEVVKEFPELQGLMGGFYARRDGLDERVALGLEQFYLPAGPKSAVPATPEGGIVSLAGKLDSLAGNFLLGQGPTGSADPYGLRRQALGALRIVLEQQLPVNLEAALLQALEAQPKVGAAAAAAPALLEFVWGRAQSFFEEKGFRVDEVRSVSLHGLADLRSTYLRLCAVRDVRKLADFEPLAAAFKRASNILRQAKVQPEAAEAPERERLREEAELKLYDALGALEGQVRERLANDDFEQGLRALVAVKPHLDLFFDKVMVMAEDAELRRQRLSLLAKVARLFGAIADLSALAPAS